MADRQTVAVLGAGGLMGLAMARNLARDGYAVRAWNRSRDKAEPLTGDGAEIFDSPAQAAAGADVVLTMLADADSVLDTINDVFSADLAPDAVWLQMSTIGEAGTDRCIELAAEHELGFVDAPVLGTKAPAEGLGLDPQLVLDAVAGGPLDLPYLQMKGKAIMDRQFEPSFRLALAAKDASLVQDAAERHELDLPLVRTIRARLDEGVPQHGDKDMCATYLTSAPNGASA
jgi:3-hydroxyisobutyrate dehydrogenase-like beta-hydroxyacid dehydrogenase